MKLEEIKNLAKKKFNENLSENNAFIIKGLIEENGLSFYKNDFYVYKNMVVVSIEGYRQAAAKNLGAYSIFFKFKYENGEEFETPIDAPPFIVKAILKVGSQFFEKSFFFREFNTDANLWLKKPYAMIQKVAEASVLRMAINLGGVYIQEELEQGPQIKEFREVKEVKAVKSVEFIENKDPIFLKKQKINDFFISKGYTQKEEKIKLFEKAKNSLSVGELRGRVDLTLDELDALLNFLKENLKEKKNG